VNLRITTSLQTKLILSLLTVVAVSGVGALMVGKAIIDKNIVNQAYESVGQTLEMYGEMYANRLYVKHRLLGTVASYPAFQRDVRSRKKLQVYRVVKELLEETTFDVLNVTDAEGRVLVRSKNYALSGDLVADDPYVRSVLAHDYPVYGFDVMDREQILRESPELAERAAIPIIPTDRSRDADRTVETRGMFLKVASPIRSNGVLVGVIYGALLLNNDSTFPDRAQTLVFGDQKIDGRDIGTATLFLDDVRISTNVRGKDGKRAFGTLVSREVYDKVFKKGDIWRNKAFVVDRWYIAAYKPVKDLEDKTIGIMYTGVDEAKFGKIQRNATISFVLMIFFSGAVSILLAVYLIHHFISPIGMLVGAAKKITAGQYSRVDIRTDDEMGYLSEMFNSMVDALEEKDRRLMEHVEKQIQQSEKLASLGRLSSGIAHEINNPLTGVLTYSGILMEALRGTEYEEDLKVIQEETLRCRDIVREILDFSRETTLEKEQANLNEIIRDLLGILEKHVAFQNVRVVQDLDPSLPNGLYDINQIKSVINNLAVNAADAMPDGGTITFHTRTSRDGKFAILRVSDTGVGIPEENLPKVFDPFFTTKETGKGTGLGLSVTYGIIKRHQGFIRITSKVGEGTTVDIRLPVRHQEDVS
jgi:two-component system NtrC family sensor kinase